MNSETAMDEQTTRPVREPKVEPMPIEYLEPNPFQVRSVDPANLGGLIRSIERYGFVGHLEARPNPWNPGGRRQLVFGHRRLRAAELAGLTRVPIKVTERSDTQMRELAYIENGTVESLSYWDEGLHFRQLQDAGMSMPQIAEAIGKSKGYVQARLDVLRLPDGPLRDAARTGQIEMSVFSVLLTMPEGERTQLFEAVQRGEITATQLRAIRASMNKPLHENYVLGDHGERVITISKDVLAERWGKPEVKELDQDLDVPGPDPAKLISGIPVVAHDRTIFSPKTGRDWAQRVLTQMRGVVPILEANAAQADFTTLSEEEAEELIGLRDRVVEHLSVPELTAV